ncbi:MULTISPECIES: 50S ribosomal protein L11 methyltransferase [Sphingomonas]|uniref:50S ribosomal protein L11 methyltransferase n=1 Tax=Sphingomonas TaxID=13687 RepID=UPI000835E6B6|nr:50S ribosomal protein L11 methyltransferase [Sphingomonas sp. CCH10-B3]
MIDPLKYIDQLRAKSKGDPLALLRIAEMMLEAQRFDEMIDLCEEIIAGADANVAARARSLMLRQIPGWHFSILSDLPRNRAYADAIARALAARPGARVLEIGTGSGILAMHAVRAGAAHVVTCEANRLVAQAARGVLVANGMNRQITLFNRHSTRLTEADIGGRADILISEIIADNVLSEGVLPSHEHALRALCVPDPVVIPARATVCVALATDHSPLRAALDHLDGFDLAPFNRLRPPVISIKADDPDVQLRSEPIDLFAFDLAMPSRQPPERGTRMMQSGGGRIDGVVQWLRLDLAPGISYENPPNGAWSNWGLRFHRFDDPVETQAGDLITIDAAHDRSRISITRA